MVHVSFTKIRNNVLVPRIPSILAKGEDDKIKRICFCKSLEKALTAMPYSGKAVYELFMLGKDGILDPLLHVYTPKDIDPCNLLSSDIISSLCPDALFTGEVWVMNQKVKCMHHIIRIKDIEVLAHKDIFDNEVFYVDKISFEFVPRLTSRAPEVVLKPLIDQGYDIRQILVEVLYDHRMQKLNSCEV